MHVLLFEAFCTTLVLKEFCLFAFFLGMFKVDGACFQLCHTPAYEGYHYECYKNKYWCYHFLNVVIFCCKSTIFF